MLDFFVTLFGGLFCIGEGLTYKSNDRKFKRTIENDKDEWERRRNLWEKSVINKELEAEMTDIACNHWKEEPYFSEIITAAKEMGWDDTAKSLEQLRDVDATRNCCWYYCRLVLMANRGFLPDYTAGTGICIDKYNSQNNLFCTMRQSEGSVPNYRYDLMIWVTKKLQEKGVCANPVQRNCTSPYNCRYLTKDNYSRYDDLIWDAITFCGENIEGSPEKLVYSH